MCESFKEKKSISEKIGKKKNVIDPAKLQELCDNHPDYIAYKKACENIRRALAKEKGITYEEFLNKIKPLDFKNMREF